VEDCYLTLLEAGSLNSSSIRNIPVPTFSTARPAYAPAIAP